MKIIRPFRSVLSFCNGGQGGGGGLLVSELNFSSLLAFILFCLIQHRCCLLFPYHHSDWSSSNLAASLSLVDIHLKVWGRLSITRDAIRVTERPSLFSFNLKKKNFYSELMYGGHYTYLFFFFFKFPMNVGILTTHPTSSHFSSLCLQDSVVSAAAWH